MQQVAGPRKQSAGQLNYKVGQKLRNELCEKVSTLGDTAVAGLRRLPSPGPLGPSGPGGGTCSQSGKLSTRRLIALSAPCASSDRLRLL